MPVYQDKDKNGKIIKTKDGRSWYFKVYKNGKPCKSKKYLSKKEAKDEEALFRLKLDCPYNKPFNLVANAYFDNIKQTKKESTVYSYIKDYHNHIEPYFKNKNISALGMKDIREWAEQLKKCKISVKYMNKIHNILNHIFDYAIKNYELENNPSRAYGPFEEKHSKVISDNDKLRYITYEEFETFISYVDDNLWNTFFSFAYYSGCRRGEIQALTWKDIDFNNNEIIINKTLYEEIKGIISITSTKNNLNRKIKMNKTLKEILTNYKEIVSKYEDFKESWYLFGNTRFLPKTTINRYKDKYFKLSGIHNITMHEFRHSHVSLLINEYVKVSKDKSMKIDTTKFFLMMSNRMGHTIQVMQETYMHLFPTIQDEIVELLDNL